MHAVGHAGLLYLSGLTALGTAAAGASLPEQADAVLRQLRLIAELRTTLFRHYGAHLPASSVVQVQSLFADTVNIEIEAIIALPQPAPCAP